jgi:hypothetical protein
VTVAVPTVWQATGQAGLAALYGARVGVRATGVMGGLSHGCSEPSSHSSTSAGGVGRCSGGERGAVGAGLLDRDQVAERWQHMSAERVGDSPRPLKVGIQQTNGAPVAAPGLPHRGLRAQRTRGE